MPETIRMTLDQIVASGGSRVDHARLNATTEAGIGQHMIEDRDDPDSTLPYCRKVPVVPLRRPAG